jgi:hypothetical protein
MKLRVLLCFLIAGFSGFSQIRQAPAPKPKSNQPAAPAGVQSSLIVSWQGDKSVVIKIGDKDLIMTPMSTQPVKVTAGKAIEIAVKVPGKVYNAAEFFIPEPGAGYLTVELTEDEVTFEYESQASRDAKKREEEARIKREEEEAERRRIENELSAKEYSDYQWINSQYTTFKYDPYSDYSQLESLRKNCSAYLRDYQSAGRNNYHYNDVTTILDVLNNYPKSIGEFQAEKDRRAQQEAERKRAEEADRKRREEAKEQERIRAAEEARQAAIRAQEEQRIRDREARRENNRSASFISFYSGQIGKYGLSLDNLEYKKIGFSMSFRSSFILGDIYDDLYVYVPEGEYKIGKTCVTGGITFPIIYPFCGFADAGIGEYNIYQLYSYYGSYTGTYYGEQKIKSGLSTGIALENSLGLIIHWGRYIAVKSGVSFTNLKMPEYTFGVGFNVRPKKN